MVSHENFLVIGYVYAIFGTLGFLIESLWTTVDSVLFYTGAKSLGDVYEIVLMPFDWVSLVFFATLLVGIYKQNLSIVKIHRVYLIVASIITMECVALIMFMFNPYGIFPGEKLTIKIILISYMIGFVLSIVQYLFFKWIINGVIAAIQSKRASSDAVLLQSDMDCRQNNLPV